MNRAALLASLALLGGGLWLYSRRNSAAGEASSSGLSAVENTFEDIVNAVTPGPWKPPSRAAPYLSAIHAAEDRNGMPRDLLTRLLYQETRFRPEIIDGTVRSSVGAAGLGQFMPATAARFGINPLDPFQAIDGAARYLAELARMFGGDWGAAVASYNWGEGNWRAYLQTGKGARGQARPQENIDYVAQITADVPIA